MDKPTSLSRLFSVKILATGLAFAFISTPLYAKCSATERAEMIRAGLTAEEVREVCLPTADSQSASEPQSQPSRRAQAVPQPKKVELKRFQVGLASYASIIAHNGWREDYEFSGGAIFASIAFNDHVAIRGLIASSDEEHDSDLSMSTREISLLFGTGLATQGGKFYGMLGHYNDEITDDYYEVSTDFSGIQFGIGGGYSWKHLALDIWINVKDSTDYEEHLGLDAAAVSAGLGISGRF